MVVNNRINSIASPEASIDSIIGSYQIRVEEIPEDQLKIDQRSEYLLPVAHFCRVKNRFC